MIGIAATPFDYMYHRAPNAEEQAPYKYAGYYIIDSVQEFPIFPCFS